MNDADKRAWVNDLLQAVTASLTTAEQIELFGTFFDRAFLRGNIEALKLDVEHEAGHPFHAGQRQAG